ncbi:GLIPR1-like protein 1 [Babylonia areolata]|uniref:GLIPR1-like protein 1 n=1 Tax=Babylonia areolata TaxID=304850 RepID=UPI003FD28D11
MRGKEGVGVVALCVVLMHVLSMVAGGYKRHGHAQSVLSFTSGDGQLSHVQVVIGDDNRLKQHSAPVKAGSQHHRVRRADEKKPKKQGFNSTEQKQLVVRHNQIRSVLDASNMLAMNWNTELQKFSQARTDLCVDSRTPAKERHSENFPSLGENMVSSTYYSSVKDVVDNWLAEREDYNYSDNTCGSYCEQYKQMVWHNTSALGCGITFCQNITNLGEAFVTICSYGPEGNTPGVQPYKTGKACSECGPQDWVCTHNLCATLSVTNRG